MEGVLKYLCGPRPLARSFFFSLLPTATAVYVEITAADSVRRAWCGCDMSLLLIQTTYSMDRPHHASAPLLEGVHEDHARGPGAFRADSLATCCV